MARCGSAAVLLAWCAIGLPAHQTPPSDPQPAGEPPPVVERFTANIRVCELGECARFLDDTTVYSAALDLLVHRWTTAEEVAELWGLLGTRGWHALAAAVATRAPVGVLHEFRRVPAGFRQAYPLHLAMVRPAPGNRRVASFLGVYDDDEVRCLSLDLDASGTGTGTLAVALAAVAVDGDVPFLCAGLDRIATLSNVHAWPPGR
jgi:hypothetical protein